MPSSRLMFHKAQTMERILCFMFLDVKKKSKLKKKPSVIYSDSKVDVLQNEIKFNYKVYQNARDLIIMRVKECS